MMAKLRKRIAWRLWQLSCQPTIRVFKKALERPAEQQINHLKSILGNARGTQWQKTIGLSQNAGIAEFRRAVPIQEPGDLYAWTDRIRAGEQKVLTRQPISRLVPTSGTAGPAKLIPMNPLSRKEFSQAVNLWIADLLRRHPKIREGRCYIATSPAQSWEGAASQVPVGFAHDEEYLSGIGRWTLRQVLAVPQSLAKQRGSSWSEATREHLLRATDLSFISIWHPSYLEALFSSGELESAHERWPQLQAISSWADGACESAAKKLMQSFPWVSHCAKGLWLTEGAASIPWQGQMPLALLSAFFEFEDFEGNVWLAHELKKGQFYRPVISNHAGLYRYRLGDTVSVDGYVNNTPSIRWLGRADKVCDLCGEKLNEAQVTQALREVGWDDFALLTPQPNSSPPNYTCFLKKNREKPFPLEKFERALKANPHYKWAREIGQLGPISPHYLATDFPEEMIPRMLNETTTHAKATRLLRPNQGARIERLLKDPTFKQNNLA